MQIIIVSGEDLYLNKRGCDLASGTTVSGQLWASGLWLVKQVV